MQPNDRKHRAFSLVCVRALLLVSVLPLAVGTAWQVSGTGVRHAFALAGGDPRTSGSVSLEHLVQDLAAVALLCAVGALAASVVLAAADAVLGARLPWLRATTALLTPRVCRRIVALCCGAGLAAPVYAAAPAGADDDSARHGCVVACTASRPHLGGLPLPDLPTGYASRSATSEARLVVGVGDSLWRLAERRLPAGAPDVDVLALTERIYDLNRQVIGADPDLIFPGTALLAPEGNS